MKDDTEYIATKDAAAILGFTHQHVRLLLRHGKLRGMKFGRDWLVSRESVFVYISEMDNARHG